ncbi:hypothetical protein ARMSODRAFT_628241 [Armillaria solidipes]|uniref:Uncharacterized protein n=1 Tax=Armillaria solidipes TaxID=1076256 RepID=A0A2H3BUP3_9AGAR|nr:hypothetical protein ARMSODRAFT_628241 [Armillaria solidipes]
MHLCVSTIGVIVSFDRFDLFVQCRYAFNSEEKAAMLFQSDGNHQVRRMDATFSPCGLFLLPFGLAFILTIASNRSSVETISHSTPSHHHSVAMESIRFLWRFTLSPLCNTTKRCTVSTKLKNCETHRPHPVNGDVSFFRIFFLLLAQISIDND